MRIVAILSLALGVGANTAIFQLLDAVRIRTLPVTHPDELAEVRIAEPAAAAPGSSPAGVRALTNPLWEQIRDRQQVFTDVFAWSAPTFDLTTGGEARDGAGAVGQRRFLQRPGRAGAASAACSTPATIGAGAPRRRPSSAMASGSASTPAAPSAIGRTITLDGHPFDIVGVTPASFFGVEVGRDIRRRRAALRRTVLARRANRAGQARRVVSRRDGPAEAGL